MQSRERGFSLIEVLAAVSLLIILFIPLVRAAIDGLRSEGESRRRLEASLLADNVLAEIESGFQLGIVPNIGEEASEVAEFRILSAVTRFDVPFLNEERGEDELTGGRRTLGEINSLGEDFGASQSIFPPPDSSEVSPLRKIEITVSWPGYGDPDQGEESDGQRNRVVRTTFAFDVDSVSDRLESLDLEKEASELGALLP